MTYVSPTLVLDVGANKGQFVNEIRKAGYLNQVVSFESLKSAYDELSKNAESDSLWHIHERCAIGSARDKVLMNRSENSVSSSILPMLKTHSESAKDSIYVDEELVDIFTLDEILPSYIKENEEVYLKIDTQGYE